MPRRGMLQMVSLKMSKTIVDVLEAIAAVEGKSRSEVIREAVACYVARKVKENPVLMEKLLSGLAVRYVLVHGSDEGEEPRPGVRRVRL